MDCEFQFLDIRSAYLMAYLDIKQYMKAPEGVEPPNEGEVMELIKGLYTAPLKEQDAGTLSPGRNCWSGCRKEGRKIGSIVKLEV